MAAKTIDLAGQQFGRLKVVRLAGTARNGEKLWHCQCSCGTDCNVRGYSLRSGHTASCGCIARSRDGVTKHPLYPTWKAMVRRCHSPDSPQYGEYGARGIHVHPEWRDNPAAFYAFVGDRPEGHTLDRIDNAKGYEPGNVKWATASEQRANQRRPPKASDRAKVREMVEDIRERTEALASVLDGWEIA